MNKAKKDSKEKPEEIATHAPYIVSVTPAPMEHLPSPLTPRLRFRKLSTLIGG